jgi:hypothetical protein
MRLDKMYPNTQYVKNVIQETFRLVGSIMGLINAGGRISFVKSAPF